MSEAKQTDTLQFASLHGCDAALTTASCLSDARWPDPKGFAPMPPAPITLEAWWLRGVVAKGRSGLSKPCRNRAGEDAFR